MKHEKYWGKNVIPERFLKVMDYLECGDKVLDIGSGRGAYVKELNHRGIHSVGLDINKYEEWSTNSNCFIVSRSDHLPLKNKYFDIAIAFEVLEHVENYTKMLTEIRRCTKKYLILSVPNCDLKNKLYEYNLIMSHWVDQTHVNFFTKDSIIDALIDNSFEIVTLDDCFKISINNYYWNTLRVPQIIKRIFNYVTNYYNLSDDYWSSILVVARIN